MPDFDFGLYRGISRKTLCDEQLTQLREIHERSSSREEVRAVFTDEQWALLSLIWFRVAVPQAHPEISVKRYEKDDSPTSTQTN
jgi:hypothetical protein